jgi:hypothetical protein
MHVIADLCIQQHRFKPTNCMLLGQKCQTLKKLFALTKQAAKFVVAKGSTYVHNVSHDLCTYIGNVSHVTIQPMDHVEAGLPDCFNAIFHLNKTTKNIPNCHK